MSNPYYNHGTTPATNSSGSSALVRAEFDSITNGFALLPPLTPGGFVVGNAGGSALAMSSNISESGTTVTVANALTVSGLFTATANGNSVVSKANILATARAINGVNFDGSAAITVADATKLPLAGGTMSGPITGLTDLTTTGNTILGDASTDTLNVGNGGLVKDASGNVLIGTTTALQSNAGRGLLEINGSTDSMIEFKKGNVGQGYVFFDLNGNGFLTCSTAAAGLNFLTNATTRLTINNAGVIADGAGNSFQPIVRVVKTAATARTSTIALADDPHLVAALGAGTWSYRVWLPVWSTTANTGQFKFAVAYSGTNTTNLMSAFASKSVNSPDFRQIANGSVGFGSFVPTVGTSPTDWVVGEGVLVATGAGNISVQWAQTVSDPNATNVGLGGYMVCTKIG